MCTYSRARTVAIPGHVAEAQGDNVPSSSSRERTASIRRPPLEHVQKPRVSAASLSQGDCLPGLALAQMKLMTALFIYSSIPTAFAGIIALASIVLPGSSPASQAHVRRGSRIGRPKQKRSHGRRRRPSRGGLQPGRDILISTSKLQHRTSHRHHPRNVFFVCSSPPFAGPARPQ